MTSLRYWLTLVISSEVNVITCAKAKIEPLIATGRQSHNQPLQDRFAQAEPLLENPLRGKLTIIFAYFSDTLIGSSGVVHIPISLVLNQLSVGQTPREV